MRRFIALALIALALLAGSSTPLGAQNLQSCSTASGVVTNAGSVATTKIISGVAGNRIHVCVMVFAGTNVAAGTVGFVEGTGTNCGTGTLSNWGAISGAATIGIGNNVAAATVIVGGFSQIFQTQIAGNDLCLVEATQASSAAITFAIAP